MANPHVTLRDSISTFREWHKPRGVIYSLPMKNIGEKIRKAREDRDLGRRELLERAGLGDSPPSRLANYESGLREPTLCDLERIARGLGLSLIALLQYGSEQPLVALDGDRRAVLNIWEKMEPEEQSLWLKRGNQILKSRGETEGDQKLTAAAAKSA